MSAGLIPGDVFVDRLKLMFVTELPAQIARIDTVANALGATHVIAGAQFTTPTIDAADIATFLSDADHQQDNLRIAIELPSDRRQRQYQGYGSGAGQARSDHDIAVTITVDCETTGTSGWGDEGALRRAERTMLGIVGVLQRWPRLDVPNYGAGALATIALFTEHDGYTRGPDSDSESVTRVRLVLPITVRSIKAVATA